MTTLATRRQLSSTMLLAAIVLAGWIPLLTTYVAATAAWSGLFWQGLDVAELVMLAAAGVLAWRRHPATAAFAAGAALLLVTDAGVDVLLALGAPTDLWRAIAMALFAELPLALLCVDLARQSLRRFPEGRALLALQPLAAWRALRPAGARRARRPVGAQCRRQLLAARRALQPLGSSRVETA